jgi:hypothetical protein
MTERVTRPSEADSCNWADGGSAYPSTDPGSSKRAVGFKPLNNPTPGDGDIIPAEDHNFLWRLGMEMLSWVRDFIPREWSDVSEGIANTTASQLFKVFSPIAGIRRRGSLAYSAPVTASTGGVYGIGCTDGEQLYYRSGLTNEIIVAADPTDGSEIWENDPDSQSISGLTTDGGYVYYTTSNVAAPGLRRLNRSTGAYDTAGGTTYNVNRLVTNGEYCAGIDGSVGNGNVTVWSGIQGTIAEDGQYNTTSPNLTDIAICNTDAYVCGARSTYDIWRVSLGTLSGSGFATLPTVTATPAINGIATDGNMVYVVIDRTALAAPYTGNANLFVYSLGGSLAHVMDVTTANLDYVAVDDMYLYVVDDSDSCRVLLKDQFPAPVSVTTIVDVDGWPACDGVSIICRDATSTSLFQRNWMHGATKEFMRTNSDDPERRPFFNLAIPTGRV